MKTSFTTLACPDWTIDRVVDAAVENKYDAIDFRGYLDVVFRADGFQDGPCRHLGTTTRFVDVDA